MKKILLVLLLVPMLLGFHKHRERWYQDKWCEGQKEVVMADRTRVDCLTETHAIEIDFGHRKWYEAVGQALHYSRLTGKKPGIGLIIENEKDDFAYQNLLEVIAYFNLGIDVWQIKE